MSISASLRRAATTGALLALAAAALSGCGTATASQPTSAADDPGWAILSSSDVVQLPLSREGATERDGDILITDGATGFGWTEAPDGLDITQSFTVAAWVSTRADPDPFANAMSQIGDEAAGFFLGTAEGVPAFSMKDADTNEEGHTTRAIASEALQPDEWVHLAGVFDADEGEISLYVNGGLVAETPFSTPFRPDGPLTVGRSQAHGVPADFWNGAITEVRIVPDAVSADTVVSLRDESEPKGAPPVGAAVDPSTYGDGALNGTWDYVLTPDELAIVETGFSADELATFGPPTAIRLGFDGPRWWQGVVSDDEVFVVNGHAEGDGGTFSTEGSTMTWVNPGGVTETFDWSIDGDQLTLVMTTCTDAEGVVCGDIDLARVMFEHIWTFRSSDPSF